MVVYDDDNISLEKINRWADLWHYKRGINIFPLDNDKATSVKWSNYQQEAIPDELHEEWKRKGQYTKGMVLMPGKVWRGENQGIYFVGIDFDKELGFKEFCNIFGSDISSSIDELQQKFIIEQHANDPSSIHLYFYSEIPFTDKSSDTVLGIEIKSNCKGLMCATPSYHSETDSRWQIKGTDSPITLKSEEALRLMFNINNICTKYRISYLDQKEGRNSSSYINPEIRKMLDSLEINHDIVIEEGERHNTLISIANSLLFNYWANESDNEKKAKK